MDIPLYDGVDYRYQHTDSVPEKGLAIVANLLGIPPVFDGSEAYDLFFYSGGCGIINQHAISITASESIWKRVATKCAGSTPEQAEANREWSEALSWLFVNADSIVPLRPAAVTFINENRKSFQSSCDTRQRILIGSDSDVKTFDIFWGDDMHLNYLGFDQG